MKTVTGVTIDTMSLGAGQYTTHLDLDLTLQAEPVAALLEAFVAEEVRKTGLQRVVVGLSGGLDSGLACAIAVRALGAANVLGVLMPYTSSRPESRGDAEVLAAQLGMRTLLKPIATQIDVYFESEPDADRLRRGNKMARERMTILYDLSAKEGALVLGTSNKTELLLGYSTLWGDSASAINPNGDLYKTQAFQMGAHYDLPQSILTKPPSADLWTDQTSEGELGLTFYDIDRLLYLLVDQRLTVAEVEGLGIDAGFVRTITERIKATQFKRSGPLIAKVSARTVGIDFRYLRDWGS